MKLAAAEPTKQLAFADYPSIGINAPQDSLIPKVILNGRYDTFGIPISEHVSKIDLCLVAWID